MCGALAATSPILRRWWWTATRSATAATHKKSDRQSGKRSCSPRGVSGFASKDALAGLDNIDTGLQVPPNAPADRVALAKANLRSIAYDTLGVISMNKKDYATAELNFQKAADLMK